MDDIYKNIEEYNPNKKRKKVIIFDDMLTDMLSNKTVKPVVTKLFIKRRKLNISLAFITQPYFAVSVEYWLHSTHYFVMKIPNKRELQQIPVNHSSQLTFQTLWIFIKDVL